MLGRSGLHISKDRRPEDIACKATMTRGGGLSTRDIFDVVSVAKVGRHSSAEREGYVDWTEDAEARTEWTVEGRWGAVASLFVFADALLTRMW